MPNESRMPRPRRALRGVSLALSLVLALGLGQATREALGATDGAAGNGVADPTLESLDQLYRQLGTLRKRVEGMEGKLKDSARARKQADQARMEAERHLAEGAQALEQARAQIKTLESRQRELEQRLADQESVLQRMGMELQSEREGKAALTAQIEGLKAQLPEADGGTLSAEDARLAAAEAFRRLKARLQTSDSGADSAKAETVTAAEEDLYQAQRKLARAINARSVYRIRPKDSLAIISSRFYGAGARWQTLFEANRHLVENPDQLAPGMSLIIP